MTPTLTTPPNPFTKPFSGSVPVHHAADLPRQPRILILSGSVGSGHMRAAEAIELALRQVAPAAYVRNVDVLTLATPPFRRCYGQMYVDLIDVAPQVLGFFYNLMDKPTPLKHATW